MELTIAVIYGSVREQRQGIKAALFINKQLEQRNCQVKFVDAKKFNLPLLNKMHKEFKKGEAPENIEKLSTLLKLSDGFIIVTGEYNHSIPPALKNLLDHFQSEYYFKPSGIVSYSAGIFGGLRAAVHVRAIVAELGMSSVPSILPVPKVQSNFDEEGNTDNEIIKKSTQRFIDEFIWYAEALKVKRNQGTPY